MSASCRCLFQKIGYRGTYAIVAVLFYAEFARNSVRRRKAYTVHVVNEHIRIFAHVVNRLYVVSAVDFEGHIYAYAEILQKHHRVLHLLHFGVVHSELRRALQGYPSHLCKFHGILHHFKRVHAEHIHDGLRRNGTKPRNESAAQKLLYAFQS